MSYMNWEASLETGIPAIDDQHQKLIAHVNELYEAMKAGRGRDVIGEVLKKLAAYTDYHFTTEERAFDRFGYPDTAAHKAQHSALIKQVGDLITKFNKGEVTVTLDTLQFLTNWVRTHIKQQDKAYVPFLSGKDI